MLLGFLAKLSTFSAFRELRAEYRSAQELSSHMLLVQADSSLQGCQSTETIVMSDCSPPEMSNEEGCQQPEQVSVVEAPAVQLCESVVMKKYEAVALASVNYHCHLRRRSMLFG